MTEPRLLKDMDIEEKKEMVRKLKFQAVYDQKYEMAGMLRTWEKEIEKEINNN